MRIRADELPNRIEALLAQSEGIKRLEQSGRREASLREIDTLLDQTEDLGDFKLLAVRSATKDAEGLREIGDRLRDKLGSAVVVLGGVVNGRPVLMAMVTDDLVSRGLHAGHIVREAAKYMDGGGGGQPRLAQAGGKDAAKLDDAIAEAVRVAKRQAG